MENKMDKTRVDDMLIEMITPKMKQIEEKFGNGEGLTQDDINTLLLKSQYNHINHLDKKLDEVVADVASLKDDFVGVKSEFSDLKGDFSDLKGEFTGLKGEFTGLKGEFDILRGEFKLLRSDIESTIEKALNKNMMLLITVMGAFVILSKLVDKI
jgi:uncharacterized coiled-coil DUF342 family protein